MRIVVSGSSGFIGSPLVVALGRAGHRVTRLIRTPRGLADEVVWDPARGIQHPAVLEGVDAVVHLAGESVAGGRWTAERKRRIRDSRVQGTRRLCEGVSALSSPPRALVCASAIGYYGDRGEEVLTEDSSRGGGFLAEVCEAWEQAAAPAIRRGVRVVYARFGVVLSPAGGALAKLLPLFQLGVGGPLGNGRQYMSWVALDDVIGSLRFALETDRLRGPMNVVAPTPITNRDFTKALGRAVRRPAVCPAPAFMLRLLLGEFADETLLASARVVPATLQACGYRFQYPELDGALRHLLSLARSRVA